MESRDADAPAARRAPGAPLRVLHCEETAHDSELVERVLHQWDPLLEYRRVAGESAFRAAFREHLPDLVLCDYTVPGFGGAAALKIARESSAIVPFIFVSETIGEESTIESLRQGTADYVLKERLTD